MIEVYKMFNGLNKVSVGNLFARDINVGRGYSFKLLQKRVQAQLRQRFFTDRTVNFWISLTEEVVSNQSIYIFKNKLDLLMTR